MQLAPDTSQGLAALLQDSQEIRKSLHAVEPLPAIDILAPAIRIQMQLRKHLPLSTEIVMFKSLAANMGASRRHRLVTHLRSALQSRAHELFQGTSSSDMSSK